MLDVLGRLLDLLAQTGQAGLIGSVLLLAALGLVVWGLVRLVRRVRGAGTAERLTVGPVGRSPDEWLAEARAHEAAERWREALRCHHRTLIAELAGAGLVEEVPGRTAAEYETEVAEAVPDAAEPMGHATRLFERAWYAHAAIGPDEIVAVHGSADAVRRAASLRVPAGRP